MPGWCFSVYPYASGQDEGRVMTPPEHRGESTESTEPDVVDTLEARRIEARRRFLSGAVIVPAIVTFGSKTASAAGASVCISLGLKPADPETVTESYACEPR